MGREAAAAAAVAAAAATAAALRCCSATGPSSTPPEPEPEPEPAPAPAVPNKPEAAPQEKVPSPAEAEGSSETPPAPTRRPHGPLSLPPDSPALLIEHHTRYLLAVLRRGLPSSHQGLDPNRLTLVHFAVAGLDVLGQLERLDPFRTAIIDWVYCLQTPPPPPEHAGRHIAGFRGGPFLYFGEIPDAERSAPPHDQAHLAMAYSALVVLRTLGDDLSRLNAAQIREGLGRMQRADGGMEAYEDGEVGLAALPFAPFVRCSSYRAGIALRAQCDMRFLFCAAAVERLLPPSPAGAAGAAGGLRSGSSLDADKLVEYIVRSQNYDGGIGLGPGMESHGGSTYCTPQPRPFYSVDGC